MQQIDLFGVDENTGTLQLNDGDVGTLQLNDGDVGTLQLNDGDVDTLQLNDGDVGTLQLDDGDVGGLWSIRGFNPFIANETATIDLNGEKINAKLIRRINALFDVMATDDRFKDIIESINTQMAFEELSK